MCSRNVNFFWNVEFVDPETFGIQSVNSKFQTFPGGLTMEPKQAKVKLLRGSWEPQLLNWKLYSPIENRLSKPQPDQWSEIHLPLTGKNYLTIWSIGNDWILHSLDERNIYQTENKTNHKLNFKKQVALIKFHFFSSFHSILFEIELVAFLTSLWISSFGMKHGW